MTEQSKGYDLRDEQSEIIFTHLRDKLDESAGEGSEYERIHEDPEYFLNEILGAQTYGKQVEIIKAVRDHRRVAVNGANKTGKDWLSGRIILWWLAAHQGKVRVLVVGPSHRQVRDVVWRELRSAYSTGSIDFGVKPLSTPRWEISEEQFAQGFATDDEYNLQGFHSPSSLVIVTEAHNVSDKHMDAIKRLHPKCMLLTGNPFSNTGEFFDAFHAKSDIYTTVQISALDSPNVKAGEIVIPGIVTADDVEDAKNEWGEDHPFYRGTILGEFVGEQADSVVPLEFAKRCQGDMDWEADQFKPIELGVDVGRGGDETVIFPRYGVKAGKPWRIDTRDTMQVVAKVVAAINATSAKAVKVDSIGMGAGVVDRLRQLKGDEHDAEIFEVDTGQKSTNPERFVRLRSQLWWEIGRNLSESAAWDLSDCDDVTIAELVSPRWSEDASSRVQVERKKEVKKRLRRSTDNADALLLAFYRPKRQTRVPHAFVKQYMGKVVRNG